MNGEINIGCEGTPLRSVGAANIYLNTGKTPAPCYKPDDRNLFRLNAEKQAEVGVHINTTLSIGCPKKVKVLFILNFLLSILSILLSSSIGFYFWNEATSMRRQVDSLRDQLIYENANRVKIEATPLMSGEQTSFKGIDFGQSLETGPKIELPPKRKHRGNSLGDDLLIEDSRENLSTGKSSDHENLHFDKEPLIAHFNGAIREINIGSQSLIGPWVRDLEVSSKNSDARIEMNNNYVTIKEDGVYLVYAQVVYLSHAPNSYFVWGRTPGRDPRLLTSCSTGNDSSHRPLDKSQISCATQTVVRLQAGDTVNIAQRELHVTLWLRPGYTYIGFIKLSS